MAEVKSTLELVMERTRHLTLTEEDRREQALAEFNRSLSGLLQKVQDGVLSLERFKADLRALQESSHRSGTTIILEEFSSRMDLDGDNTWVLNLLAGAFGVNTEELAALFREYRQALESLVQNRTGEFRKNLLERHGIRGSAVIPNCDADPEWATGREHLRERFKPVLRQAVARLKI